MGTSHALTGTLTGMVVAASVPGMPGPVQGLTVIVFGGASLLPDMDTPAGTAARSLGLVTRLLAKGMDLLALQIYHSCKGPKDPVDRQSGHRLFTHTVPGSVLAGALVGLLVILWPPAATVVCALLGGLLTLPLARFFRAGSVCSRFLISVLITSWWREGGRDLERGVRNLHQLVGWVFALAGGGFAYYVLTSLPGWAWLIPVCVTAGCLVHIAGDLVTNSGVPIGWFPLIGTHKDRRWAPVRTFSFFDAGGHEELLLIRPALLVANLVAGLWLAGLIGPLWTAATGGGA